jgi:DNA-binding NarL/FixJ family response regulator
MTSTPVLLVTHDDLLWQHWRGLDEHRWLPARARNLNELKRWREQGRFLALLDANLPRRPDWRSHEYAALFKGLLVVVASSRPTDDDGTRALAAGAAGYCHSYAPPTALAQVLNVVDSGGIWMGRSLVSRLLKLVDARTPESIWHSERLTERENAVTARAVRGQTNAEIADALGITERTVKAHLSAVFDKLGVSDRLQLALLVHGIAN